MGTVLNQNNKKEKVLFYATIIGTIVSIIALFLTVIQLFKPTLFSSFSFNLSIPPFFIFSILISLLLLFSYFILKKIKYFIENTVSHSTNMHISDPISNAASDSNQDFRFHKFHLKREIKSTFFQIIFSWIFIFFILLVDFYFLNFIVSSDYKYLFSNVFGGFIFLVIVLSMFSLNIIIYYKRKISNILKF